MRNDKRDNEHRMIHCSGCGKFLATCKEVISLNIICPKCRTVTIADLKSGELKTNPGSEKKSDLNNISSMKILHE